MESALAWARGPVFLAAFTFMILGLIRHAALTLWETAQAVRRAGDKRIPYGPLLTATLKWLFPVGQLRDRFAFSLTSVLFHLGAIIAPVFLAGHIALWTRATGASWPAIPNRWADVLTVTAVAAAAALTAQRLASRATRALSRLEDYAMPLIAAAPFASGFFVMHPAANPLSYEAMLLVHVMSANFLFVLIPLTKLSHMALFPMVQLVSEAAWHWPPDAGSRVATALGKEKEAL